MPLVSLISLTDDSVVFFEPLLAPDPGWGIFGLPPIQSYLEEGELGGSGNEYDNVDGTD